jgi:hypothetical protein
LGVVARTAPFGDLSDAFKLRARDLMIVQEAVVLLAQVHE